MTQFLNARARLIALFCSTAMIAATPLTLELDAATGLLALKPTFALAKNGSDDAGGDDNGGRGGDDDDHEDRGSDDDGDDDNGGSDDSQDDGDDSDDDSNDDDSNDDDSDDSASDDDGDDGQGRGRGRGRGRGHGPRSGDHNGDGLPDNGVGPVTDDNVQPGAGGDRVVKIERSAEGIEVTFRDGTKIEIENGRYERKNANGRTVEERLATQADVDQLLALR